MQNLINYATDFKHIFWVYKLIFSVRKWSGNTCKIGKFHTWTYKDLKWKLKKDLVSPWYPELGLDITSQTVGRKRTNFATMETEQWNITDCYVSAFLRPIAKMLRPSITWVVFFHLRGKSAGKGPRTSSPNRDSSPGMTDVSRKSRE